MKLTSHPAHVPGELLVRLKPAQNLSTQETGILGQVGNVVDRYALGGQATPLGNYSSSEILRLKLHSNSPEALDRAIQELSQDPHVAYAVTNDILHETAKPVVPNDLPAEQYGPRQIAAPQAWAEMTGDRTKAPLLAVIDGGVDITHPDLLANLWTNPGEIPDNGIDDDGNGVIDDIHGFNAVRKTGNPVDESGHGTHVTGTVGAVGNNGQGVTGVAWQAKIAGIKFLEKGYGDLADAISGIVYADKIGARVTQNSWGGSVYNQALRDALAASPALHIFAAGNDGNNADVSPAYPAAYPLDNIVSVAATDSEDQLASFSNYGIQSVDLAAPGVKILSTIPGGVGVKSGTSMAAPHVSGAASLILEKFPHLTNKELKDRLVFSVDHLPQLQDKVASGGRLNLARALEDDTILPGQPTALSGKADSTEAITLHWTASGDDGSQGLAAAYELAVSDQPFTLESFERAIKVRTQPPLAPGNEESLTIPVLPSANDRQLYVGLRSVDNIGQRSALSTTEVAVPAAHVAFEDGSDQWTREGDWGQEFAPGRGTVWSDSPGGDYKLDQNASLTSRPFSLQDFAAAKLRFDAHHDLEINFDKVFLELRAGDDKAPWTELCSFNLLDGWKTHTYDLSAYAGQPRVQLRFRLKTDQDVVKDGFQFHHLVVTGDRLPAGG